MRELRAATAKTVLLVCAACWIPWACATTKATAERRQKKSEQVEGGIEASPSQRTSDDRPTPYLDSDDHGPFDESRMGIDAYRVYKQQMEGGENQKGVKNNSGKKKKKTQKRHKHATGPAEPAKPQHTGPAEPAKPERKGPAQPAKPKRKGPAQPAGDK